MAFFLVSSWLDALDSSMGDSGLGCIASSLGDG